MGTASIYDFRRVTKKQKNINWPGRMILAENTKRLRDRRYAGYSDMNSALAKDAGHSLSTIQRMTDPNSSGTGTSIDVIANVAAALGCRPCELLMPRGMQITEATDTSEHPDGHPTNAEDRRAI